MAHSHGFIAKPAKGRYFAHSLPEMVALVKEFGLIQKPSLSRVELIFRNLDGDHAPILRLEPRCTLVIYSFGEDIRPELAHFVVRKAMEQFALLDRAEPIQPPSSNSHVTYRAYMGPLGKLTVTRRVTKATRPKYRGDQKFSNAFKWKVSTKEEKVVYEG